jgi:hypothetical protein
VVTVGGIDRTSKESFEKTQTSRKFKVHTFYNTRTTVNDIAVIQMPQNFAMSEFIKKKLLVPCLEFVFQTRTSTWSGCRSRVTLKTPSRAKLSPQVATEKPATVLKIDILKNFKSMSDNTGGASSSVMNYVDLSVISNSECAGFYGSVTVASTCICTGADSAKSICNVSLLLKISCFEKWFLKISGKMRVPINFAQDCSQIMFKIWHFKNTMLF